MKSVLAVVLNCWLATTCIDSFPITTPGGRHHHEGIRLNVAATDIATSTPSAMSTETAATTTPAASKTAATSTTIVAPGDRFRSTAQTGELSVASFNMLAPFYHSLGVEDWQEREKFANDDRLNRVPLAVQMAKQANADILCLQEVEGGPEHEPRLQELLSASSEINSDIEGYDSCLWAPLMPNRPGDVVGLCIAWRSSKHRLVASDCYKRGMICQLAEIGGGGGGGDGGDYDNHNIGGATFAIANVHLPARPSNVMGRLMTMSRTVQKLTGYDPLRRQSHLDGLLMVCGDFNCDHKSVTARLLTTGKSQFGNVRDRNYKANVSKAAAGQMKHGYRFQDVYDVEENLRNDYAPVTVSLHGRGPGCMDQMFFAQLEQPPNKRTSVGASKSIQKQKLMGRRKVRRAKAAQMRVREYHQSKLPTMMQVESILATVAGPEDTERLEIINSGLPNVQEGFPSDHIPVGALFVANSGYQNQKAPSTTRADDGGNGKQSSSTSNSSTGGGVSSVVQRRRVAGLRSMSIRRRHNVVLGCVADWLSQRGARDLIRDQPLYKNPLTNDVPGLTKKSRAPDLICRLGDEDNDYLVVVEVTVTSKPEAVRRQKIEKYSDLPELLPTSPTIQEAGCTVCPPLVIVLDESGRIPDETRADIDTLAALAAGASLDDAKADAQRFCNYLQAMFTETQ